MHKQKLFYTPVWTKRLSFDVSSVLPLVDEYEIHRFDEDIPEDCFFFDGTKKGFTTRMLTLSDIPDDSKQAFSPANTVVYDTNIHMLCNMISENVKTYIDSDVELIDFQFFKIKKGNYQKLIANEKGDRYVAHYTLQMDDVPDAGEYRFMNPNTLAKPLYHPAPPHVQTLLVWPSGLMYEMLTYQGDTDRISLLLNYGEK